MTTTYRITVKTDDHRTRYMLSPTYRYEVRRPSARAAAHVYAEACRMLASHAPASHRATAWIELSDRFGPRTLAKFAPRPEGNGVPASWLLNEWAPEYDNVTPDRVECGTQRAK